MTAKETAQKAAPRTAAPRKPDVIDKTWAAFKAACRDDPTAADLTDAELYQRMKAVGVDDYNLPDAKDTFINYMSKARARYGERKNRLNAPQANGKTIVNARDLDSTKRPDVES